MSSNPPLPILRLPTLVISEILRCVSPKEMVLLSFCSQRTRNLIKLCRDKKVNWHIEMFGDGIGISHAYGGLNIEISKDAGAEATNLVKIGDRLVPIKLVNKFLHIFWEPAHWKDGIKATVDYFCDLLNRPVHVLDLNNSEDIWMIEWVCERQLEPLEEGLLDFYMNAHLTSEEYEMILRKFRPTKSLFIQPRTETSFQYNGTFDRVDLLIFQFAPWFTIEHLMSLNSIYIRIGDSTITHSDMNIFLQHWLSGGFPRLMASHISIEENNYDELFKGFEDKVTVVERARVYIIYGRAEKIPRGFDIQRDDGVIASVSNGLVVVWPDMNGKEHFDFYYDSDEEAYESEEEELYESEEEEI